MKKENNFLKLDNEILDASCEDYLKEISRLESIIADYGLNLGMYSFIVKVHKINPFILLSAIFNGFYYIYENDIRFSRHFILVGNAFVLTKPVYAVKEKTLKNCYYKSDTEELKFVDDAHYWDWKTFPNFSLSDYGKTWSLKKEDLLPLVEKYLKKCLLVIPAEILKVDIESICKKYDVIKKWAYILHDKDDNKPHYHIYLNFGMSSISTEEIAKWFLLSNFENKIFMEVFGLEKYIINYFIYSNSLGMFEAKYSPSDIKANFNINSLLINKEYN